MIAYVSDCTKLHWSLERVVAAAWRLRDGLARGARESAVFAFGYADEAKSLLEPSFEAEMPQYRRKPLREFVFSGRRGYPAPITAHPGNL